MALVYGGAGALGRSLVAAFRKHDVRVVSVDLFPNDEASHNVLLTASDSWQQQSDKVLGAVSEHLGQGKLRAVVNVAGGWAGGNIASADVIANSDLMWRQSVHSSVISGQVAAKFLDEGGLLVLPGANAATGGTPGMIAYGMAKAAVHQLVRSLAANDSGLPARTTVLGLLPITLDTPANRKWAGPDTDFGSWTPLDVIANKVHGWATQHDTRPSTGSLVQVITVGGETSFNNIG